MGIFRMYTGEDGRSVIKELQQDDPILESLRNCRAVLFRLTDRPSSPTFIRPPASLDEHVKWPNRY